MADLPYEDYFGEEHERPGFRGDPMGSVHRDIPPDPLANLPTVEDLRRSSALLRVEADQLDRDPAEEVQRVVNGLRKVANTLDSLQGPLGQFEEAMNQGQSPLDFMLAMMAGSGNIPEEAA